MVTDLVNTSVVSDEWLLGPDRAEREAYAFHLEGRMWSVVFPGGAPQGFVTKDRMRRAETALEEATRVIDRYLWGQATREEYQQAMVFQKAYWEAEMRRFRQGEPL